LETFETVSTGTYPRTRQVGLQAEQLLDEILDSKTMIADAAAAPQSTEADKPDEAAQSD